MRFWPGLIDCVLWIWVTSHLGDHNDDDCDDDLGRLVYFSQKSILNKRKQILSKMHFKPIGSSAVVELHKLTLHCDDDD